ncbi:MAG: hypothetical protein B6I19_03250 [Bacteroidetes bacterium 4572_114]|nr:MAG: hypothetical protein B6I19_03250 [Bacteroidetes bacterium 4572_114]
MISKLQKVRPLDDYLLLLTYENGEKRKFDVKPYLDLGIFKELKDKTVFNTVRKSFDTIEWANEADLDPEII